MASQCLPEGNKMLDSTGERYLPWMEEVEIHYEHLHRYRFAREFVKGKRVLDLACGEGYGSFMLAEDAREVVGIDLDEATINHASSRYLKENLKFIKGSITDVPIHGEKIFEVVVCFEALEHIKEHDGLMKEVKRLLATDGVFIVSTPNKDIYSDEGKFQNPFHVKELYFNEFKTLLDKQFTNTILYGQKVYPSSNIFPLYSKGMFPKDYAIEKGERGFLFAPSEKKDARYFIAVSSNSSTKDMAWSSCLVDISQTLLKQKEAHITQLEVLVREKDINTKGLITELTEKERIFREIVNQKDGKLLELSSVLSERDSMLGGLNETLRGKEVQLSQLEATVSKKKEEIGGLEDLLTQKDGKLSELSSVLSERDSMLGGLNETLREKEVQLSQLEATVSKKKEEIGGLEDLLTQKDGKLSELSSVLSERDSMLGGLDETLREKEVQLSQLEATVSREERGNRGP